MELKTCPFCGCDDIFPAGDGSTLGVYRWRECIECGARGPRVRMDRGEKIEETSDRAARAWNERIA